MAAAPLTHALNLAAEGFRVFPLIEREKLPAIDDFPSRASTDPLRVNGWWTDATGEPEARNIGISTGQGLVVIDFDMKAGQHGAQSLFELVDIQGLPETRTVRTASGGVHLYYRTPPGCRVANSVGKIARNVDVRGEGGYVVAPGSATAAGTYTVDDPRPIADAPDWLIERCGQARERSADAAPLVDMDTPEAISRATDWLRHHATPSFKGAGGDQAAYKAAAGVKDFGVSETMALELLLEHWNERGSPQWSPERLQVKVENAYSYGSSPAGSVSADAEFGALPPEDPAAPHCERVARSGFQARNIGNRGGFKTRQDYVIRGFLNRGMVALMSGPSNAGKSPLALDMAAAVAKGEPWQGRKVRKGYVLYISTEGWSGIETRIEAVHRTYFPGVTEGGAPFDYYAGSIDLRTSPDSARDIVAWVNQRAEHFGVPPALVIIDTMSHALGGGDESNPEHVRAMFANCQRITRRTGAAVMMLHHPTKDASSDYRGSSILINDTDLLIKVDTDAKTKVRTVSTPRVKEYAEIEPLRFRINVVELGHDDEGDPITSVVVAWQDAADFGELPATGAEVEAAGSLGEWSGHLLERAAAEGVDPGTLIFTKAEVLAFFADPGRVGSKPKERSVERLVQRWKAAGTFHQLEKGRFRLIDPPSASHPPPSASRIG